MGAPWLGWIALLVAAGSAVAWFRWIREVRLPRNRAGMAVVWASAVGLGASALWLGAGWLGTLPAVLAIAIGGFFLFTVAISRQQVAPDAITVGGTLPEFTAPDEHGGTFESASLRGSPALLKFFRGHW